MKKTLSFNKNLYSKEAVIKASYNFIDDYYIHLDCSDEYYFIDIEPKEDMKDIPADNEFLNEILIQETRIIVNDRTGRIRELLYSRAMASTIIDESEDYIEEENDNYDADVILTDWFEENEENN